MTARLPIIEVVLPSRVTAAEAALLIDECSAELQKATKAISVQRECCLKGHSIETVLQDWVSLALGFRNSQGYFLHGKPCSYSEEIIERYGSNAELHRKAAELIEDSL